MARVPTRKELTGARLLKEYASWMYCAHCNKTVAYLCYVTYDAFDFVFTCACGSKGAVHIAFDAAYSIKAGDRQLVPIGNRLCCPLDQSPLVTFVDKNLNSYKASVVCKRCNTRYAAVKEQTAPYVNEAALEAQAHEHNKKR